MSVLVDQSNQPFFWPNVFTSIEFRYKSPKTSAAVLRTLGMFELWLHFKKSISSKQLANGRFLDMNEIEDLANFLRLSRPAQDKEAVINKAELERKVIRFEKVRKPNAQFQGKHQYAGRVESANRIRWTAMFLEYLRDRSITALNNHQQQKLFEKKSRIGINRLRKLAPRGGSYAYNEDLVGIDEKVVHVINYELSHNKASPYNPFKTKFTQARNQLIWSLLLDTGMRRGELIKLKVEDIDYSTRRVRINESKTLPRTVPISEETAQNFHHFIMEHWSKLPPKQTKHGRLFTSKYGCPLKTGTINLIFERIRNSIPGVPGYLTPHTLRRTWNERYSSQIDKLPQDQRPSVEKEIHIRNRLMGWSDNSQEGARYAKRHIRRAADTIAEDLANSLHNNKEIDE